MKSGCILQSAVVIVSVATRGQKAAVRFAVHAALALGLMRRQPQQVSGICEMVSLPSLVIRWHFSQLRPEGPAGNLFPPTPPPPRAAFSRQAVIAPGVSCAFEALSRPACGNRSSAQTQTRCSRDFPADSLPEIIPFFLKIFIESYSCFSWSLEPF